MIDVSTQREGRLRREEILRAAAAVMRRNGMLVTRLQDVAAELGVAYTALYHYFPSRDHLVEGVVLSTIAERRTCLDEAAGESALDRLSDFVRRDLSQHLAYKVPLPHRSTLPPKIRGRITRVRNELLRDVAALIDSGIAEGSIGRCHAITVANVLLEFHERFVALDDDAVAQVVGVLRNGILRRRAPLPRPSFELPSTDWLLGTALGLDPDFDRMDEILRVSTLAFNAEGPLASIPRIAETLGVSKTVVYQFAVDKQDLVFQCYLRGAHAVELSHRIAADYGRSPLDEVLIHRTNLYRFHASDLGPFPLLNAQRFLRASQERVIQVRNQGVRRTSEHRLERGIAQGEFRIDIDPAVVQPLFGQALYGLPGWYSDGYPLPIDDVTHETGQMLICGLAPLA